MTDEGGVGTIPARDVYRLDFSVTEAPILLERIYDHAPQKGYRVLVDRLWPRGISKEQALVDEWCKELAPSPALRTWFGHKPERWDEFRKRYTRELTGRGDEARALLQRASFKRLVLVYGAKDREHTHALVLREYLLTLGGFARPAGVVEVASPVCYAEEIE